MISFKCCSDLGVKGATGNQTYRSFSENWFKITFTVPLKRKSKEKYNHVLTNFQFYALTCTQPKPCSGQQSLDKSCAQMFNLDKSCVQFFNLDKSCAQMFNLDKSCVYMFNLDQSCAQIFNLDKCCAQVLNLGKSCVYVFI